MHKRPLPSPASQLQNSCPTEGSGQTHFWMLLSRSHTKPGLPLSVRNWACPPHIMACYMGSIRPPVLRLRSPESPTLLVVKTGVPTSAGSEPLPERIQPTDQVWLSSLPQDTGSAVVSRF